MRSECVSDVADYAGCVFGFEPNVERTLCIFNRTERRLLCFNRGLKIWREIREPQRAGEVYQVADYSACSRHLTRAGPDQHHFADRAPADEDRVVGSFDRS